MKKIITFLLMVFILLSLTACGGKDNPTNEEIINVFVTNDLTKDNFKNANSATSTNEDRFVSKISFEDKRISTDSSENGECYIAVFNNNQEATIANDYEIQKNNDLADFCNKNELWKNGKPVLVNNYVHQNGNLVIVINGNLDKTEAQKYFDVLDDYLGNIEYKQINKLKDNEYEELYASEVLNKKDESEKYAKNLLTSFVEKADKEVNECLSVYENDLSDENKDNVSNAINVVYKGKAYDELRKTWNEKLDVLNAIKEEKDAEYQIEVDRITALVESAISNPTHNTLDAARDAIGSLDSSISYFKKFKNDWDTKLNEVEKTVKEADRDKEVADINNKLDRLESNLSTSLYDEINDFVSKHSSDSLYSSYISNWKNRLKAVEADIKEKKHMEEIQEFKNSCKSIGYTEFSRNSDSYTYEPVYFKGEVVQVVDQDSKGATLRVNVTYQGYGWYSDTIYVKYDNSDDVNVTKILEDDIVKIWGYGAGDVSYKSVLGATITIPAVYALYIDIQ